MLALALAVAIVSSCGGTGPVDPPASIAGSWSSWPPGYCCNPAGPAGLLLKQYGTTVTGTYSWAGISDAVSGEYDIPNVRLTLTPDDVGLGQAHTVVYTGQATHPDRMVLNGATFYKQ